MIVLLSGEQSIDYNTADVYQLVSDLVIYKAVARQFGG